MPVLTRGYYVPETRPFEPPYFFRISQCQKWGQVTDEMCGDELLWRTYWKRFNTVEIPILPQDEFFDTALSIAKLAGGRREEFERMFEEKNKERWEEVERLLGKTRYHAENILKGTAYGYEADVIRDEPPDNAPNSLDDETQMPDDEYFDEDGMPRTQMFNFDPDICFYEEPSTKDWREHLMADNVFYIGSYTVENAPPDFTGGNKGVPNPETGRTSSMSPLLSRRASTPGRGDREETAQTTRQGKRKRKSVRFDDDVNVERHQHQQQLGPDDDNEDNEVNDRAHKRARLDASSPHLSSLDPQATNEGVSKKRTRHDDDNNDRQKRQKLETPISPAPTPHVSSPTPSAGNERKPIKRTRHGKGRDHGRLYQGPEDHLVCPPTPSASSSTTATGSTASRKRSRQGDDHDNGFKRQKLEDPAPHTPPSHIPSSTQRITDERIYDQKEDARKSRTRRESSTRQSRKRPSPPSRSLNTRSRRRSGPSTFLELDQSGKPRSV
ncbi:hypothetical protein CCMA1212_003452 [Trichoderma ghanense]|uniref:Uncharacterized protein n=1 Tax=Trichoderma ghanense TaxID=65468 RepID=A0ABY2HB56_9HYPO